LFKYHDFVHFYAYITSESLINFRNTNFHRNINALPGDRSEIDNAAVIHYNGNMNYHDILAEVNIAPEIQDVNRKVLFLVFVLTGRFFQKT
ncbi:hypothetical protein ACJX0J_009875, partial [Zea mays]